MLDSCEILLFTRELTRLINDYNYCPDPAIQKILANEIDQLNLILEKSNS